MKREKFLLFSLVMFGMIFSPFDFSSAQAKPQQKTGNQYDAAAVIKLVTVRILDSLGRPVTTLQKENFTLFDNGKEQIITEFEVHTTEGDIRTVQSLDPQSKQTRVSSGMPRQFFLFFDIQGSDINGMTNAKEAALHFINTKLLSKDKVGIIGFAPMRGFFIQEYLTDDTQRIIHAIKKAKEVRPSDGELVGAGGDSVDRKAGKGTGGGSSTSMNTGSISTTTFGSADSSTNMPGTRFFQKQDFITRMSDLAGALKHIPGTKNIILFSGRSVGSPVTSRLGKEFADASTPVYTVNTKNWIRQGIISLSVKKKHIYEDHPLKDLALASGGKYFADIKQIDTISEEIQNLTGNYYVLGYYVRENWDGAYHQIEVRVLKPDLEVYAQDGYFNPKPYGAYSEFEKELQLSDLLFSEHPSVSETRDITGGALHFYGGKKANVALFFSFAVDAKTSLPPGPVEFYVFLKNDKGETVKLDKGDMDLTPLDQKELGLYFLDTLPEGEYECRIVARNPESGQTAEGRIQFHCPGETDTTVRLSSPLLFSMGPECPLFRLSSRADTHETDQTASLKEIYQFFPKDKRLVIRTLSLDERTLLVVLPISIRTEEAPLIDFNVFIQSETEGEAFDVDGVILDVRELDSGTDIVLMEVALPELPPGNYRLTIEAKENDTPLHSVHRNITIR
ncbi:MAG: VWA domain-containing protein [Acidobacteriota bacterium]